MLENCNNTFLLSHITIIYKKFCKPICYIPLLNFFPLTLQILPKSSLKKVRQTTLNLNYFLVHMHLYHKNITLLEVSEEVNVPMDQRDFILFSSFEEVPQCED
ncbi:hypothetical protein KIL84_000319 [Mauremys mutica]|uniref:Uncharacterized protein n=1 Tax=Mauremys mutica TaxID=74926 RepID=A0A9D3XGM9_9SAUR|nr:hypothetical protein KIL84_000319 [Mauremys mutica]